MSTVQTIQEKINAKADKSLEQHLNQLFNPVIDLPMGRVNTEFFKQSSGNKQYFPADAYDVLHSLKRQAFALLQEHWREKHSVEFLASVESLQSQINDLQSAIED